MVDIFKTSRCVGSGNRERRVEKGEDSLARRVFEGWVSLLMREDFSLDGNREPGGIARDNILLM